ncbi:MAG TPA: nucleotidyltransferase domain-containing protein [Anaerolineae bacterium]|nr:nucleotidyltransferase domain-containing protein [Anaerolineae bacterium]HIQ05290.1 nucleotidyltransferase domain-containing protein [Anaerolineae bacterium]
MSFSHPARDLTLLTTLTPAEVRALDEFCHRLLHAMPGQVRDLVLFGSRARGEGRPGSDLDLLVVLDEVGPERR